MRDLGTLRFHRERH